jgi:hypothetical protein
MLAFNPADASTGGRTTQLAKTTQHADDALGLSKQVPNNELDTPANCAWRPLTVSRNASLALK